MDLYMQENATFQDGTSTLRLYDIEPNKYYEKDLSRRNRFYQSLIDSKLLPSNSRYQNLPDLITIWILPYDPFGDDRMIYTIKNIVVENQELVYNVKSKEDVGERYMTLQEMIDYEKRDTYEDGLKDGHIRGIIEAYQSLGIERNQTKEKIMEQFQLSSEQAEQYLDLYW